MLLDLKYACCLIQCQDTVATSNIYVSAQGSKFGSKFVDPTRVASTPIHNLNINMLLHNLEIFVVKRYFHSGYQLCLYHSIISWNLFAVKVIKLSMKCLKRTCGEICKNLLTNYYKILTTTCR